MKPISSSRFPIPSNTRNAYSEIEKKLKDSELKLSETNLRALKQILEGLQALERERRTNCTHTDCMYIAQILLASGILLRDLGSGSTTFQLHSSGLPINPELFFVLEQTKASSLLSKQDGNSRTVSLSNPDHEKFNRKFIFDLVNEILVGKLALVGTSSEPWINSGKLVRKTLNAEKLLEELCMEIEQLQAKKSNSNTEEEGDLKNILLEDVICRPESWFAFNGEISGTVLDVERLVFKDLINETVIEGILRSNHQQKHRRCQLFSKNSTVEAKLMGLRPLPDSSSAGGAHLGVVKTGSVLLQPLRSNDPNMPTPTSNIPKSSLKDPTSLGWKIPYMTMKPISSSRILVESAPWREADGTRGQPPKHVKVPSKTQNSFPSCYSETLKRLKDPEFKQSGKDLRALLEAMQAKELLEIEKEEQTANLVSQRDCEQKCTTTSKWYSRDENNALGIFLGGWNQDEFQPHSSKASEFQPHSSKASGVQPNSQSGDEFQLHSPNYYDDLQQCSVRSIEYYDYIYRLEI